MIPHHQAGSLEAFLSTQKIHKDPQIGLIAIPQIQLGLIDLGQLGLVACDPQGAVDMCVAVDGVQSWMEAKDMSQQIACSSYSHSMVETIFSFQFFLQKSSNDQICERQKWQMNWIASFPTRLTNLISCCLYLYQFRQRGWSSPFLQPRGLGPKLGGTFSRLAKLGDLT